MLKWLHKHNDQQSNQTRSHQDWQQHQHRKPTNDHNALYSHDHRQDRQNTKQTNKSEQLSSQTKLLVHCWETLKTRYPSKNKESSLRSPLWRLQQPLHRPVTPPYKCCMSGNTGLQWKRHQHLSISNWTQHKLRYNLISNLNGAAAEKNKKRYRTDMKKCHTLSTNRMTVYNYTYTCIQYSRCKTKIHHAQTMVP